MLKFKIILVLAVLLQSCVTQKKCMQKFPPAESRDSIYIETIKEVPVLLPGDTINIEVPIACPDQDLIKVENSKLKQEISIIKGKLISNTTIKEDTVFVKVTETVEKIREVKVPEPVKYIPEIYRNALWMCIIIFAGAFTWFGFKIYKFFS